MQEIDLKIKRSVQNIDIGVVTGAQGQLVFDVTIYGESGHAGTVPMVLRADALSCAVFKAISE